MFNGNSLHFQGLNRSEWYEATFTLPAKTNPQQLRATITGGEQTDDIGAVIGAIFKIEDGTLTLAGFQARDQPPRKRMPKHPQPKNREHLTMRSRSPPVLHGWRERQDDHPDREVSA